jgi:hypothetical protein
VVHWVFYPTAQGGGCKEVAYDLDKAKQHALLLKHGHSVSVGTEK